MEFQQVKPQKGSDIVLEQLRGRIESGFYPKGTKLPTVVDLAAAFQVGRSTIREALSGLKAMGWVDIRHGGGTYVRMTLPNEQPADSGFSFEQSRSLRELQEVRRFIETGCVSLAAARASEAEVAALRRILGEMEAALGDEEASELADIRFHQAIAQASHNSLLIGMMESLTERLQSSMKSSRRLWFFAERASAEGLLAEHRAIVDAIAARDEAGAATAMAQHIQKVDRVIRTLAEEGADL
ncbi:FadR/GntR family transcriptional regulator [Paenibacillus ferrarius]|uniref:FadR/GntR family transcriptional regulator n=1 Tax=Paenibacillus ferrarius TaxID=1469647 RepID=UPI003D2D2D24